MRGWIVTLLAVASMLPGGARAAEPPPAQSCACAAAFDRVVAIVEADYAGYPLKVDAERREAYDAFKAVLRADAAGAGPDRCVEVLKTYTGFFQDHHVFVLRGGKPDRSEKKTARAWTEPQARAEIERRRNSLDPVEGLWYSRSGRFAVLREDGGPAGTFFAVRLAADGAPSSDLAATLRRDARGRYRIARRDAEGRWQTGEVTLHRDGALLVAGIESWGRLLPEVQGARLDPADPQAPFFTRLDAGILYLSLPSFLGDYRKPLNDIVAARGEEIAKARGLVIDVRGNSGGDAIYFGLAEYLITGPIRFSDDSLIVASESNLHVVEQLREKAGEHGKIYDPAIQRMRENPGKLVPFLESWSEGPATVSPGPRRVAILTDRGVGSAAEALVLQLRQSPRAIVVGENTKGNIDYPSVYLSSVGCGDQAYQLGVPLYAGSRDLPAGGFDGSGIAPDVPVKDSQTDPLAFAVRLIAATTPP